MSRKNYSNEKKIAKSANSYYIPDIPLPTFRCRSYYIHGQNPNFFCGIVRRNVQWPGSIRIHRYVILIVPRNGHSQITVRTLHPCTSLSYSSPQMFTDWAVSELHFPTTGRAFFLTPSGNWVKLSPDTCLVLMRLWWRKLTKRHMKPRHSFNVN